MAFLARPTFLFPVAPPRKALIKNPSSQIQFQVSPKATATSGMVTTTNPPRYAFAQVVISVSGSVFAPPPPTGLTGVGGRNQVALTWNASPGADTYNVYPATLVRTLRQVPYSIGGSVGTTLVVDFTWVPQPPAIVTGVSGTSYTVTGLQNGVKYGFFVTACKSGSESYYSGVGFGTPWYNPKVMQGGSTTFPSIGTDMTAELPSAGAWDIVDPSGSVIATNDMPNGWAVSAPTGPPGGNFTVSAPIDAVVAPNYEVRTDYLLQVPGAGGVTYPMWFGYSAIFDVIPALPSTPTGLVAVGADAQVTLAWNPSLNADSYNLYRSTTSGGSYSLIQSGIGTTSCTDSAVNDGTQYFYVVSASNSAGESGKSNEASAVPFYQMTPPVVPTTTDGNGNTVNAWTLNADPGDQVIVLYWTPLAGAKYYHIYRSFQSGGPYTQLPDAVSIAAYVDMGLTNGTRYFYVVTAVNPFGESGPSKEASAVPGIPPTVPTGLYAYPGNAQVTLQWQASTRATSYLVKESVHPGGPYNKIIAASGTSCVDTGLINGKTYYYIVTAIDPYGESGPSKQAAATPTASRIPLGIIPHPPLDILPDPLGLPLWEDSAIPRDSSDSPGGGPSSILGVSLPFGVVEADSGSDVVTSDPIVGSLSFGRLYRSALAAAGVSSPGLPAGWTHNWDYRIVPLQSGVWGPLKLVYPNGAWDTLTPSSDPTGQSSVSFNPIANAPYKAVGVPGAQPGQWVSITLKQNGTAQQIFSMDQGDTVYRLHTVQTDTGSQTNLTYSSGLLSTVSTSSPWSQYSNSNSLWCSYDGSGAAPKRLLLEPAHGELRLRRKRRACVGFEPRQPLSEHVVVHLHDL